MTSSSIQSRKSPSVRGSSHSVLKFQNALARATFVQSRTTVGSALKLKSSNDIQLRGEDVASALRDGAKEDIKGAGSRAYDLGKFFFGVSAASIAIITSGLKDRPSLGRIQLASLAFLVVSMFVAVLMVLPRLSHLQGNDDLLASFEKDLRTVVTQVWVWFGLWLTGFALLLFTFFHV